MQFFRWLLIGWLLSLSVGLAQPTTLSKAALKAEKEALKAAEMHLGYEEWREAIPFLENALSHNPHNARTHFDLGRAWLNIGQYTKGLTALEKAYQTDRYVDPALEGLYAEALHFNRRFEEAIKHYRLALPALKEKDPLRERYNLRLTQAVNGARLVKDSVDVIIENMGPAINSPYPDYVPVISADQHVLMFTSRRPGNLGKMDFEGLYFEDVYLSTEGEDGKWSRPVNLGEPINTKEHDATASLSADGQRLFIYRSSTRSVYQCDLKGNSWSDPKPLPGDVVSRNSWEPHACQSADGRLLFFNSDRPGGQGGLDLYVSLKQADGKWGPPINLGPKINTPYDERSPFFHPDGKTLYFSSEGHNAMGGQDIFKTTREEGGVWTAPVNIGYPINTPGDDVYFVMAADGRTAYISSSRPGGYGEKDIYRLTFRPKKLDLTLDEEGLQMESGTGLIDLSLPALSVTVLKGVVSDQLTKEPIEAKITITDNRAVATGQGEKTYATLNSNAATGKYLLTMPADGNYGIAVEAEGYLFHSENFKIPAHTGYQELERNIELQPIEVGKKIVLHNIFFDTGEYTLRPESRTELDRLFVIMKENPQITIQISGHTDNVGTEAANQVLSKNRAQAVVEFLTKSGISPSRMRSEGYGESKPIDTNETPEGRQRNRRTEFEILTF